MTSRDHNEMLLVTGQNHFTIDTVCCCCKGQSWDPVSPVGYSNEIVYCHKRKIDDRENPVVPTIAS